VRVAADVAKRDVTGPGPVGPDVATIRCPGPEAPVNTATTNPYKAILQPCSNIFS